MKNVFRKITLKALKKNRTRTLVTITGILLAASMLTAVTTFIASLRQYMIQVCVEEKGNWYGSAFGVPKEVLSELSADERTDAVAVWQELGYARIPGVTEEEIDSFYVPYLYVTGISDGFTEMLPVELMEGRMPENSQEILISGNALNWALPDVKIGDTLTLELGERVSDGERLSPYNPLVYTQEENRGDISIAEEIIPKETREYTITGIMKSPSFMAGSSNPAVYCMTRMEEEPAADALYTCFYRTRHASDIYRLSDEKLSEYGRIYNSELLRYLGNSLNRPYMKMMYGMGAILITLIMVGGISLVYNSFSISVSDRTKQFGLLASIGATPRQLRGMVFQEAFLLASVGIPLGIGAGILGIGVTLLFTGNYFTYLLASDTVQMKLYVSWPAILTAALTAFVTVLISAWIPARRAAKITPVEAIRQVKDVRKKAERKNCTVRKSGNANRLFGLSARIAAKHFARDRKQYRSTIFSLFISIVLFIAASSFSSYLRTGIFGAAQVPDYDISVHLEEGSPEKEHLEELSQEICRAEGVDRALDTAWVYATGLVDISEFTEEALPIYGGNVDSAAGSDVNEDEAERKIEMSVNFLVLKDADYVPWVKEQGLSGKGSQGGASFPEVTVYQKIPLVYDSEEERYKSFDILSKENTEIEIELMDSAGWYEAVEEVKKAGGSEEDVPEENFRQQIHLQTEAFIENAPMDILTGYSGLCLVMPQSRFQELAGERAEQYLNSRVVYLQAKEHKQTAERIQNLADDRIGTGSQGVFINDETENVETARNMLLTVDVFSYGFIVLISLIAAANVFNTISTAFLLRRREFAVLSSVGMTPGEMNRMLNYECLLYGFKALVYGIPVSLLVTWQIYRVMKSSIDVNFYVPAASIAIAVCSVFAVVFAAMLYSRSRLRRENIIDSIRRESV